MSDKLSQIIKKYGQDAVIMDYPGTIFYICGAYRWLTDESIAKYNTSPPYAMFYLENHTSRIEIPLEVGIGDLVIKKLKRQKKRYLSSHRREAKRKLLKVNKWLRQHPFRSDQELEYYCRRIRQSFDILVDGILTFQIAGGTTDQHLYDQIQNVLDKHKVKLSDKQLADFTTTTNPSPSQEHEILVNSFFEWLCRHRLDKTKFADILKHKRAAAKLRQCYQAGYFLYCGYGGVKKWSLEDEYNFVLQAKNNKKIKHTPTTKLNKNLPDEINFWLQAARYLSLLRDQRKTLQQKIFYWQSEHLNAIAKILRLKNSQLEYLKSDELYPSFLLNKQLKKTIAERQKGFTWLWAPKVGAKYYQGKMAYQQYKKYSVKESRRELKGQDIIGQSAFPGKVRGKVRVIFNPHTVKSYTKGVILVTGMTSPDFIPLIKKSSAVITDTGGITCHAAIVSRELKIPCIIGTKVATQFLKDGDRVEVDADREIIKKI